MTFIRPSQAFAVAMTVISSMVFSEASFAQNFPTRPLRMVVPFDPGGSTDLIGRTIAQQLSNTWGQSVLIDNRGGASTIIGTDIVAKATPDGHTLLVTTASFVTNPTMFSGKLPYDTARDFTPVILISSSPMVLLVNASMHVKTLSDLIGMAKARPGALNFASQGIGSTGHLTAELFNVTADVNITHVPYKGTAPAAADLMAGRVDLLFNGPSSVMPMIASGKLRALAVGAPQRSSVLPNVATMDEAGLKGFTSTTWNGLTVPAKTPSQIVAKVNADINKAITSPEMVQRLKSDGSDAGGGSAAQFSAFVKDETAKWARIIKLRNIRAD